MNYKNAARPKVTIKQILPIPDGYRVLEPVGDENGEETMLCFRHAAVGYCLALLEGEHCDYVVPYEIGPDGMGRVECFGTERQSQEFIETYVKENYDLRPRAIIERLGLLDFDYSKVSAYGHFGKAGLPWEE